MSLFAKDRPSFRRYWLPVVLYLVLIYLVSSGAFHFGVFTKSQKIHADKVIHVVEYAILGFLLARAMGKYTFFRRTAWAFIVAVFCLGVLYGMSDEYHQIFVPYRDSSLYDVWADAVGVTIGALIYYKKRFKRICPK